MNISESISTGPDLIAEAGQRMVQAKEALDIAILNLDVQIAKVTIEKKDQAKNQKILEAMIVFDERVIRAEADVIKMRGSYKLAEIEHKRQDDLYTAAKCLIKSDARLATN